MDYILDTNAVISLLKDKNSNLARRVRLHKPAAIAISAIVTHELYYGAFKSKHSAHSVSIVDDLVFEILEFDKEDAREAGYIRAFLAAKGRPIGPYDVLIAAQARARNLILVTHNSSEFKRVPGLQIEDWEV